MEWDRNSGIKIGNPYNPLLSPLILAEIFKHLGCEDLKACRNVCTLWKLEVSKCLGLHQVFEYLQLKDLKACRLVNRKWSKAAAEAIGKKSVITIDRYEKVGQFAQIGLKFQKFRFKRNIDMDSEDIKIFMNTYCAPATHLELLNSNWNLSTLKSILFCKLRNLKSLTIVSDSLPALKERNSHGSKGYHDGSLVASQSQYSTKMDQVPQLPNLKHLKLGMNVGVTDGYGNPRAGVQNFLKDLFRWAQNLETFCWDGDCNYTRDVGKFIVDFILKTECIQWPHLKSFSARGLEQLLNATQMKQLQKFSLECLDLIVTSEDIQIKQLYSLISSLSSTIKRLRLDYWNGGKASPSCHEFPRSTSSLIGANIIELELCAYNGTFDFLADLTNLEILTLEEINLSKLTGIAGNADVLKKLKLISFYNCHGNRPAMFFSHLPFVTPVIQENEIPGFRGCYVLSNTRYDMRGEQRLFMA